MNKVMKLISDKKHVVWDWNGTLLDDVHHAVDVMNELLGNHSMASIDINHYRSIFEFPVKNYYQTLGFDFSKTSFEDLSHRFVDIFMENISRCQLFAHSKPLLSSIKQQNKKQSILSATDQHNLNHMINHFNLTKYFDHLMGIDNKFATSKVTQGRTLIEQSMISSKETILIGDTEHDLEVAEALGIDIILVAHGHQSEERLRKVCDKVILIKNSNYLVGATV